MAVSFNFKQETSRQCYENDCYQRNQFSERRHFRFADVIHLTVCLVDWPLIRSEAKLDTILKQTSVF